MQISLCLAPSCPLHVDVAYLRALFAIFRFSSPVPLSSVYLLSWYLAILMVSDEHSSQAFTFLTKRQLDQMGQELKIALQEKDSIQEDMKRMLSLGQSEAQYRQEIADLRDDNESLSIELDAVRADLEHLKGLQLVHAVPMRGHSSDGDMQKVLGGKAGENSRLDNEAKRRPDASEAETAAAGSVTGLHWWHMGSLAIIVTGQLVGGMGSAFGPDISNQCYLE